jgi:hypothetical protein
MTWTWTVCTHSCQNVITSGHANTGSRSLETHPSKLETPIHTQGCNQSVEPQDRLRPRSTRPDDTIKADQLDLTRVHCSTSFALKQHKPASRDHSCVPLLATLVGDLPQSFWISCTFQLLALASRYKSDARSQMPFPPQAVLLWTPVLLGGCCQLMNSPPRFHENLLLVEDTSAQDPFSSLRSPYARNNAM